MIPWLFNFKGTRFTILILVILPLFCDPLPCCCCCCCFWCCYCCCCCWYYWSADSNTHHCHVCIREFCMTCSALSRASPACVLSVSCPFVHHVLLWGLAQCSMICLSQLSICPPFGTLWTGTMLHDLSQLSISPPCGTLWTGTMLHDLSQLSISPPCGTLWTGTMLHDLSFSQLSICPPAQWHMLRYLLRYLRNTNRHQSMCYCAGWMDVFNVVTVN